MSDREHKDKKDKKHKKEKRDKHDKKDKKNKKDKHDNREKLASGLESGFSVIESKLEHTGNQFTPITFVAQTLSDQAIDSRIHFNLGMCNNDDRPEITCNQEGDFFSCRKEGMYRIDFCGSIVLRETNKVDLVVYQDGQKEEIALLSTTTIQTQPDFPYHFSSSTIIPISKDKDISIQISSSGSVYVLKNFRLLISRVS